MKYSKNMIKIVTKKSISAPTMKLFLRTLSKNLLVFALLGLFFFNADISAQTCFACDGEKSTCGEPNCDFECPDCEGPDIPVDNGVWILVITGALAVVFFASRNKNLFKITPNNPS
jgi:hypothetical protein